MKQEQLDNTAAAAAKATWGGALLGGFGTWSLNEAITFGGFLIAVLGFAVQVYYKRKADKRAQRIFELREQRLLAGRTDHGPMDETGE